MYTQKIKIIIFLIVTCLYVQKTSAQAVKNNTIEKKIDSLKTLLRKSKEDIGKIKTLNNLSGQFILYRSYSEADSLAHEALKLAEKLGYEKLKGESYNKIGLCYMNQKNYPKARACFFKAISLDKKIENESSLYRYLCSIGSTYSSERDFTRSLTFLFQALAIAEKLEDTDAIIFCTNDIGFVYGEKNQYELALKYYFESLELSYTRQNKMGMYYSLSNIGVMYAQQGEYFKALDNYFKALKIAEALGDDNKIERSVWNLASAYQNLGDLSKSLEYNFRALKLSEDLKNEYEISQVLSAIGHLYAELGDFDHSMEYMLNGLKKMQKIGDNVAIANLMGNIGTIYKAKGDLNSALQYCMRAVETNKELGITKNTSTWLICTGEIYEAKAKQFQNIDSANVYFSKALDYYMTALKTVEEQGFENEILACYYFVGSFYYGQQNYARAENYLQKALKRSFEQKEITYRKEIYKILSELYGKKNKQAAKYDYYKSYIELRDTLSGKENTKKTILAELNFNFQKKQAIAKSEQEKKDLFVAAEQKRQVTIVRSTIGFALIILMASAFLYRSYRQKKKINDELSIKNQRIETAHKIIEEKKKEIMDSINYALLIQHALLPDRKKIAELLPQSFVLFKPKDIVSGDFYFFGIHHNKIFIAAADCTGHGVPGAFMSMIGTEKLTNAVKQTSNPGEILSLLNKGIKDSLHQSEHGQSNHNGMDIALCSIDLQTRTIEYAGANRPIWVIRENSTELQEIKGTVTSIGGFTEDDKTFETHQLQLGRGDTFYICSDGYADQFSAKDKKLTTKRFKNMLLQMNDKSLVEQGIYLDNFLSDWRGRTEQTDDILVVGVKI